MTLRVYGWRNTPQLRVHVAFPVVAVESPGFDIGLLVDTLSRWPLHRLWEESFPREMSSGDRQQSRQLSDRRGQSSRVGARGFELRMTDWLAAGKWGAVDLTDMIFKDPLYGHTWEYHCSLGVPSVVKTGELSSGWGSLTLSLMSPTLPDVLQQLAWVDQILELLHNAVRALGGLFAYAQLVIGESRPPADYRPAWTGSLVVDPDWLQTVQWVTLMPPRVLDRMGGLETVKADAPAVDVQSVPCLDGRQAALVMGAPAAPLFDAVSLERLEEYLRPVLGIGKSGTLR
jgi:hypothetical protein